MNIDTHQHFWRYNNKEYSWMHVPQMQSLRFDYLPEKLELLLTKSNIGGTIAVQARQNLEETRWLCQLAIENDFIKGVVGWVDLCSPSVEKQLEVFSSNRYLVGIRHVLQDEADDQFMLRNDFIQGISQLKKFNLTYDLLIYPKHLIAASDLVSKFRDQYFVIDHLAKPFRKDALKEDWKKGIKLLSSFDNIFCKISGMLSEIDSDNLDSNTFYPYFDFVFDAFGSERVILGSDWPLCTLRKDYEQTINIINNYIRKLSRPEQRNVWQYNPKQVYNIRE